MLKSYSQNSSNILIVDDTPTNLDTLAAILKDKGYQVRPAISGELAIKSAQKLAPDLILLDVMMPDMDGYETCRRLKANPITQDIPVIFLTALSDTTDKVAGFKVGAIDYITKPIEYEELLARVHNQLEVRRLTKQVKLQNQELQELNQDLERRVLTRTSQLSQTLEELKQAQLSMVQQEKMSALGQLVAGVAHEINNPVNFIYGNLTHVENYAQDLLSIVKLYQHHYPNVIADIQTLTDEIDLDFLQEDLLKIISSMNVGAERIRQIVLSLRNFSRMDEAEFKAVDIHEGIDSTIMILQHRLKARSDRPAIEVLKNYDASLPLVECYPGQLNQVFMNILSNAIDALEEDNLKQEGTKKHHGQITIRTLLIGSKWVKIEIADNGSGIPESIQQKIFDPFFTTKPIGKGTGMGMSISYQIVSEKHNGKLTCFSSFGKGSTFAIEIPIQQKLK